MGRWLVLAGVLLIIGGLIYQYVGNPFFWFGKLPGDIHISKRHLEVHVPLTSLILVSVALNLLIRLLDRLF